MNGFSAADMSTAAASGFRDGLAAQPAAAQEAVVWQWRCPRGDAEWSDCTKDIYDNLRNAIGGDSGYMKGLHYEVRALYAAPVAAAPVDGSHLRRSVAELLDLRQATQDGRLTERHELEIVKDARAALDVSTPAAPGIDLEHFHLAVQRICIKFDGDLPYISGIAEVLDLIDAAMQAQAGDAEVRP